MSTGHTIIYMQGSDILWIECITRMLMYYIIVQWGPERSYDTKLEKLRAERNDHVLRQNINLIQTIVVVSTNSLNNKQT